MESIQLAQMLADISDLNAADPKAAVALVNSNKALQSGSQDQSNSLAPPEQRHHSRVASATVSSNRLDTFGRRILTPPMTRSNSAQGSMPGTPRTSDPGNGDDIERAGNLIALYEIRAKLKQQDHSSLNKAREKINAMIAKQQGQITPENKPTQPSQEQQRSQSRYTYPKSST